MVFTSLYYLFLRPPGPCYYQLNSPLPLPPPPPGSWLSFLPRLGGTDLGQPSCSDRRKHGYNGALWLFVPCCLRATLTTAEGLSLPASDFDNDALTIVSPWRQTLSSGSCFTLQKLFYHIHSTVFYRTFEKDFLVLLLSKKKAQLKKPVFLINVISFFNHLF